MSDFNICQEKIEEKLTQLNTAKSPSPDCLHPRVLYETHAVIAYPLYLLYSKSLQISVLPADWKLAKVTTIYTKGQRADRSNYRPVSLTSVCCKILESLIRDHVMTYLLQNNLLSNKQYSFIKRRSTSHQLLQMMDKWTEYLESGGQIDVIYTDFERAF